MSQTQADIKSFSIKNKNEASYVDILISKPSIIQSRTLGTLIAITRIDSPIKTKNLPNIINDNIRTNYYSNLNANVEFSLEETLGDFNEKLKKIEKVENLENLEKSISSIIIVVKDDNIYFTNHGYISSYIYHNGKIVNLCKDSEENENKVFSDISIGKLNKKDLLFFGTTNIFDNLKDEDILNSISNLDLSNFIESIQKKISNIKANLEGAFLVVGKKQEISDNYIPSQENLSLKDKFKNDLEDKNIKSNPDYEDNTNIDEVFRKKDFDFLKIFTDFTDKISSSYKNLRKSEKIKSLFNSISTFFVSNYKKVIPLLSKNFKKIKFPEKKTKFKTTINKGKKDIKTKIENKNFKKDFNNFFSKSYKHIKKYKNLYRISSISVLVLIILVTFTFRLKQQNNLRKQAEEKYNTQIEEINLVHNEASSALIYNNYFKAKDLVKDAEELILELPEVTPSQEENKENLLLENEEILKKAYKITTLENPEILVDFGSEFKNEEQTPIQDENNEGTEQSPVQKISINKVLKTTNNLYAFDYETQNVYSIEDDKSIETKNLSEDIGNLIDGGEFDKEDRELLFLNENNSLVSIENNDVDITDLSSSLNPYSISDIDFYGSNIYFLDKINDNIISIRRSTYGYYGSASKWIKEDVDFKNVSSFTIDGYIYIAYEDGLIEKYLRGYKNNFYLDIVDPLLENIDKIWTEEDVDEMFIMDSKENRILIFNKDSSALIEQIASPSFDNLKDFTVDYKKEIIYVLNGDVLYKVPYNS
ncbi:hypothetical protein K9M42_01900 [Patescibacteria group bacterium]|nr:hypothetical protein [Patescibacteria group bacterium]